MITNGNSFTNMKQYEKYLQFKFLYISSMRLRENKLNCYSDQEIILLLHTGCVEEGVKQWVIP